MRLTTKSRYGTRLIIDLAIYGKKKPVPLSEVARRQKISIKYLEQLVRKLKQAGMISSQRGPFGGHSLAKPISDITVGDIVRTLEETTAITDCAETEDPLCGTCNQAGDCLSRWVWVEASKAMFHYLDSITVDRLLQGTPNSCRHSPAS